MQIVLTAHDEMGMEVSDRFSVRKDLAEAMVSDRWSEHGVRHDRDLLEWLQSIPQTDANVDIGPDSPQRDRMLYVISDLIASRGDIDITCGKCKASVDPGDIIVEEKDFSTESCGITMGFAGDLHMCPNRHGVLFVVTKIF
ncbi:MAG: hypothetical protein QGH94_13505 [Phycisphaerae bacterium]|jgi:hypothetical protein|nr:hypothetical protein [Phycisphaerae bacterium]